jgi:hypothetical protein
MYFIFDINVKYHTSYYTRVSLPFGEGLVSWMEDIAQSSNIEYYIVSVINRKIRGHI